MIQIKEIPDRQDHCGIVATWNLPFDILLECGLGVQHRGQQGAGAVIQTEYGLHRHIGHGLLKDVFTPEIRHTFNRFMTWGLYQSRYGTSGDWRKENLQPCIALSPAGEAVAVIHNGELVMTRIMQEFSDREGMSDTWCYEHVDTGWTSAWYPTRPDAIAAALADYAEAVCDDPRYPRPTAPDAVKRECRHDRGYVFHRAAVRKGCR